VKATLDLGTDSFVLVTRQDQANRARLERFLPKEEALIWTGSPQFLLLLWRAGTRTAVMMMIASVGIYIAYYGISIEDICGADPSRGCRKLYFWPWLGLVAAAVYTPFLWLSLLLHATGLLPEFYGLTTRQALKLRANPFDRYQSVKLDTLEAHRIAVRRRFGTLAFGWLTFLCLSENDAEAARKALGGVDRTEKPSPLIGGGSTP
jgi:hypothetical protein